MEQSGLNFPYAVDRERPKDRSQSLGMGSPHHPDELFEQIETVLRAGAGFGVVLDRKGRFVGQFEPAIAAVPTTTTITDTMDVSLRHVLATV